MSYMFNDDAPAKEDKYYCPVCETECKEEDTVCKKCKCRL